ncbi:Paraquat-inducible protein A [Pelomyxa schiedti]|nr:Paraquat-inducible protein A [Pelomyxa schiedti]
MILLRFSLFFFLLGFPLSLLSSAAAQSTPEGECGVRCWLDNLIVVIPDQQAEFNYTIARVLHEVSVNLTSIKCSLSSLGPVSSTTRQEFSVPSGDQIGFLSLQMRNVSLECSAVFNMTNTHNGKSTHENGLANAVLSEMDAELTLTLTRPGSTCSQALIAGVEHCNISQPNLTVTTVPEPASSSSTTVTSELLYQAMNSLFGLQFNICGIVSNIISTNVSAGMSDIHSKLETAAAPRPPPFISSPDEGALDLNTSPFLNAIQYVANDFIGTDGIVGLNFVFSKLTNGTGYLNISSGDSNRTFTVVVPNFGSVEVKMKKIWIGGLDSWNLFDVLEPLDAYTLWSGVALKSFAIGAEIEISLDIVNSSYIVDPYILEESITLSVELSQINISSVMDVALYLERAESYTNSQCRDIGCFIALFEENQTALVNIILNMSDVDMAVKLNSGGSDSDDIDKLVNDLAVWFISSFIDCAPDVVSGIAAGPVLTAVNSEITTVLSDSECEPKADARGSMELPNPYSTFGSAFGAVVAFVVLVCIGIYVDGYLKSRVQIKTIVPSESEIITQDGSAPKYQDAISSPRAEKAPLLEKGSKTEPTPSGPCLLLHPKLHGIVRYGIPGLIMLTAVMLISGNTSGGAQVILVVVTSTKRIISFDPIFIFTLGNSIRDMWEAGIWPLSLLIAVFSGAWPYLKLLLMFGGWIAPAWILSVKRRELLLMILDALGKWSLIDSYVMILTLVGFNLKIEMPVHETEMYEPSGDFVIEVVVEPLYGFTIYILATAVSLTLSHIIVALHRYSEGTAKSSEPQGKDGNPPSACNALCVTALPSRSIRARVAFAVTVGVLITFALVLLLMGIIYPSFKYVFGGAVGWFLTATGQPIEAEYSVLSLTRAIPRSTCGLKMAATRVIQVVFATTSIFAPLGHLVSLVILWFMPMSVRAQRGWYTLCEVLNAWSSIDVFIVAIITALLEIQQFAQFIVAGPCGGVNVILEDHLGDGATCFDVDAKLLSGCWLLFGACVVYGVTSVWVMRVCHQALLGGRGRTPTSVN